MLARFKHPECAYGCEWSPFNRDLLVTGCHDGVARIWSTQGRCAGGGTDAPTTPGGGALPAPELAPLRALRGHGARVFNTVWSPLLPDTLASGSDDKTVRVWNAKEGTCFSTFSTQCD